MKTDQPYQLACHPLPEFDWDDWGAIAAAFKEAQTSLLQQAWLAHPQPEFRPGRVRTGWTDDALLVYAELDDDDIFNPVTELNALSFKHGDVFEMFLRPAGQLAYYEFHVTPQNQKLQLRIPSAEEFAATRRTPGIPPAWMISNRIIESRVEVCTKDRQWRVLAAIPFDMVAEVKRPQPGSRWLFSFSRYDYTRQKPKPILSSTSPHQIVSFHRQQEWGMLTFSGEPTRPDNISIKGKVILRDSCAPAFSTKTTPMKPKQKVKIVISKTKQEAGATAAVLGAKLIREAIRKRGKANIIVATGASQFEMIERLVAEKGIDWTKVTAFHLDEYVGVAITHPASFRKYLWERFVSKLPLPLAAFHYINGEGDPQKECRRVGEIISKHPIDVCFAGIGENGHLAFNDPPADFKTTAPYLVVNLDEACRKQQMGEGWFKTLKQVPARAISMSIRQIMKSKAVICTVPDTRKAQAVKDCLTGKVSSLNPSSILQKHKAAWCFLDKESAALL